MTHTGAGGRRKWIGLWLPWSLAGLLVLAWSGLWFWERSEAERRIEAAAATVRARGGQASWSALAFDGYPFRLDVTASNLRLADPSGWSVRLPLLKAEAYAFAPTRWLLATDQGLTLTWPGAASLRIAAPLLRMSINSWDQHPPRISFVGDDLRFDDTPDAFALASGKTAQIYTRAGPSDQAALRVELDGGVAAPGTGLAKLAGTAPASLTFDAIFSQASALSGPGWGAAASNWAQASGQISVQRLTFSAGPASLDAHSGALTIGGDGRLVGQIDSTLTLAAGTAAPAKLAFRPDGVWLGPARIAGPVRAY